MRQEENKIKRPLFWVACAFLFGETGAIAGSRWYIWAAIIFAALFVMHRYEMTVHTNDSVHKWRNTVFVWLIFVFVGIAGYCNMSSLRTQEDFVKCVAGASCKVSGIIYDRQETTSGWVIQIRAKKVFVKGVEETKEGAEKTKEIEKVGNKLAYSGQMKIVAYMSTSEKPIL